MTEQRKEELLSLWLNETNEEWTQEWRNELTADEQAVVENWDYGFTDGITQMIQDIWEGQRHGTKE